MSNYRRLISYIYAYEGGVKGKNIGFAKLETRNGQCRIQVSVRKVFLGNQDMGVFLLSTGSEIFLGRIFLRNGAGEFRTSVAVDHVAGSDQNIDQCYGLTIHNMEDSWQNYTTIWEDAVAHAAEVELEEAVSELAEEKEMSQVPESVISEKKLEDVVANHKNSVVENIEAEIQAQNQKEETHTPSSQDTEEIPSTFVQPRKEEPQKILWPREKEEQAADKPADKGQQMERERPQLQQRFEEQHQEVPDGQQNLSPQEQLEKELNEETLETPKVKPESQRIQERDIQLQLQPQNQEQQFQKQPQASAEAEAPSWGTAQPQAEAPSQGTAQPQAEAPFRGTVQPQAEAPSRGIVQPQVEAPLQKTVQAEVQSQAQPQPQPYRRSMPGTIYQSQVQPRQQPFQGYFARRPVHGIPQQEQYYQDMMPQQATTTPSQSQGAREQIIQPTSSVPQQTQEQAVQPLSPILQQMGEQEINRRQQSGQLEREESGEGVEMETLWQHFCRTYPKIQAFDYDGDSEILTIKPQDIGLLPREIWTYGNNSFLLHGYYNHRYLILARLAIPNGGTRFLLGVPGHYYSNEKYMASMFGFPNFVMSKNQPPNDNRFGYWYTDLRLGF